ncbi:MAG: Ig domain-containing protein, partial [Muribaculaceae bacterium]
AHTPKTETYNEGEASYTLTVTGPVTTYYKIEDLASVTDGDYIIAYTNPKNSYYMGYIESGNKYASAKTDGVFDATAGTVTVQSDYAVTITKLANGHYTLNTVKGYLLSTSKGSMSYTTSPAEWTISFTDGVVSMKPVGESFGLYCNPSYSRFNTYDKTSSSVYDIILYGPAAVKTDWEPALENMSLTIGENKSVNLGSAHPSNISYLVTPADVASVDDNGLVTALKAGNATITLTWGDEPRYNSGTTSFNLTVSKKTYHFPVATVSVEKGKTLSILPDNGPQNITYASADENIFTVSEAGVITGVAVGNANVNVSWTEDDNFLSGNATVAVTVKEPQQAGSVGFSREAIRGIVSYPVSWQVAHVTGDGAVTYSATPAGIVTLDAATGEITSVNAEGTVTITATMAETEAYTGATASYTITVEKNPEAVNLSGGTATFDFSQKNAYGLYTYNSSTTGETADALGKMEGNRPDNKQAVTSITEGAVTLGIEGNYRLFEDYWDKDGSYHYELRMYGGNPALTLTFTGNGSKIKSITFADDDARSFSNHSTDDGSIAEGVVDGKTTKFTYATPVSEAVYTLSTSEARVETATITVELEGSGNKIQPALAFDDDVINITAGDSFDGMCRGVTGIDNSLIEYSVDEGKEGDSLILGENEEFSAEFYTPGVYTIRASYPGNDATVAGQAVMRVNVFPKLTVESEEALEKGFNTSKNAYAIVPHGSEKDVTIAGVPLTVKLYKGNSEHNGILNVADESHTVVMKYAGKDEFKSPEQTLHVVVRPATPEITEDNKLTVASGHSIYYRKADDMANAPYKAESTEVPAFDLTGWTQYTADGIAKPTVKTYYKGIAVNDGHAMTAANKNVAGNEMSFIIDPAGVITGIENVAVDGSEAPVRYYNLQGVQLPAAPAAGFYLEVQGSRATKRLAR